MPDVTQPAIDPKKVNLEAVVPCAEDPDLVQLEGRFLKVDLESFLERLKLRGWRALQLGSNGNIVAQYPAGALFLIANDGTFSLSRIPDFDAGVVLLNQLL